MTYLRFQIDILGHALHKTKKDENFLCFLNFFQVHDGIDDHYDANNDG